MNAFDETILRFFVSFSGSVPRLDYLLSVLSDNDVFKGFVVMAFVWWLWFPRTPEHGTQRDIERVREHLVATLIGCMIRHLD